MRVRTLAFLTLLTAATFSSAQVSLNRVKTIDQFHITSSTTAFSGPLIALATEDCMVRVFDLSKMATKFQGTGHPQPVQALAFNRAGTLLASGDSTARLYLWDVKTGQKVREFPRDRGHTKGIIAIAFSVDGQRIATVGDDDVIKVWKTAGGNPIGTILGKGANLYGVAWTASGGILTGTLADGLRLYNGTTYQLAATMPVPGGQGVNSIAATRDGSKAVTAGRDGKLSLFNVTSRARMFNSQGHSDWIIRAAVTPNGKWAASSSSDRTIGIWNMFNGQKVQTIQDTSPVGSPIGFSGDGKFFIATTLSDGLQVFSVTPPQGGGPEPKATKVKVVKKKKK